MRLGFDGELAEEIMDRRLLLKNGPGVVALRKSLRPCRRVIVEPWFFIALFAEKTLAGEDLVVVAGLPPPDNAGDQRYDASNKEKSDSNRGPDSGCGKHTAHF